MMINIIINEDKNKGDYNRRKNALINYFVKLRMHMFIQMYHK